MPKPLDIVIIAMVSFVGVCLYIDHVFKSALALAQSNFLFFALMYFLILFGLLILSLIDSRRAKRAEIKRLQEVYRKHFEEEKKKEEAYAYCIFPYF